MHVMKTALVAIALAGAAAAHEPAEGQGPSPAAADAEAIGASRGAAEGFYDLDAALAAGYDPLFDCTDAGADGAMGQHYINKAFATDGQLVLEQPDVLMYEPQADGAMHLVALEYIVFQSQWPVRCRRAFSGAT